MALIGKIQTECEFDDCFSAVVASGRTNFVGDGGDLANIYVPPNDYDTWKQFIPADFNDEALEGEFVYHMQNQTLSCLTLELRWGFKRGTGTRGEPFYQCMGTPLAMNWDCHLDWAIVTECSFNATSNQISALYTVTNMGPEKVEGEGQVVIVNKHSDEQDHVRVMRSPAK